MYSFADNVKVSYTDDSFARTGDTLKIKTLKEVFDIASNLPKTAKKNSSGMFFFYIQEQLGIDLFEDPYSEGIVGVDIDHISKEEARQIFDNFDLLCQKFGGIIACTFSNSMYNPEKDYAGLHFIIKTAEPILYHNSSPSFRKNEMLYGALLCQLIYKVLGIDLRPVADRGIDSVMKTLGQRFWMNYSELKWNSSAGSIAIPNEKEQELKDWFKGYNWFEDDTVDFIYSGYTFNSIDISTWNGKRINLGHKRRVTILNALNTWGVPHDDRVNLLMNICGPEDYAGGDKKLLAALKQTSKVANKKHSDPEYLEIAKKLLERVGINVDIVFNKCLSDESYEKSMMPSEERTIEYHFDDLLIGALEDIEKYNSERQIVLNLKEDEFINDYRDIIKEKIFSHKAIYIVADPGVGKTTLAERLTTDDKYVPMFGTDFFCTLSGDELSIDIAVPYNSVAASKTLNNKELKRVITQDINNYDKDGIKMFVWNTLKPIFEKYFKFGYKRAVFFFDESHKIVTDIYRWEVIIEMFKILPDMYSHFVFMTGTPAYEHIFLKEYFSDICFIKINKESKYTYDCTFRNYTEFGVGDMTELIRKHLDSGHLPMIYTNRKRHDWTISVIPINEERIARGERPLNVLYFNRDNQTDCEKVAKAKSIKPYDLVIATAYLNVGVDIYKDDDRRRVAIIDYANDTDSGFNEIWQFQGRNRQQDSYFEIICRTGEKYEQKKYAYPFRRYLEIAKIHTLNVENNTEDDEAFVFLNKLYKKRKFGRLENIGAFKDFRNVVLLACYYMYLDKFTYIYNIKAILKNRGCKLTEIDMTDHIKNSINDETRQEVFKFFVENIETINKLTIDEDIRRTGVVKQIDLNTDLKEHIVDNKYIMSRDKRYMDWLYYNCGNSDEWIPVLRKFLEDGKILNKGTFRTFNKLRIIANNVTEKELKNIKAAIKIDNAEEDDEDSAVDLVLEKIIHKHFKGAYSKKDIHTAVALREIIEAYRDTLIFIAENKEIIELIKKHESENSLSVALKMQIIKDQHDAEKIRKQRSNAGKGGTKKITVLDLRDGKLYRFDSCQAAAEHFGSSKSAFSKFQKCGQGTLKKVALVVVD